MARNFLDRYLKRGDPDERQYAIMSTLWVVGQYLGWVEILRREVQYLDLGSRSVNRRLQLRLNDIAAAFAANARGPADSFCLFRTDQRAIGEFMVTSRDTGSGEQRPDCLGFAEFVERYDAAVRDAASSGALARPPMVSWGARCIKDLKLAASDPRRTRRLVGVQRRLIDLVNLLDPERVRYPEVNVRGKLPVIGTGESRRPTRLARFSWHEEPWALADAWARREHLRTLDGSPAARTYRGRRGPTAFALEVVVKIEDSRVVIDAGMRRGDRLRPLDGALRTTRGRTAVNELLREYDRSRSSTARPCRAACIGLHAVSVWRRISGGSGR